MTDRYSDEPELEERFRVWLHAEAAATRAPAPLVERVRAIPAVTRDRGWAWPGLSRLAPMPAIAATVLIAAALTVAGLALARPFLGTAPERTATLEELDAAVGSAIATLLQSPGVEGVQSSYVREHLASAVWFDSRRNGDVVVVQRVDRDVAESGWWLAPSGSPPAVGRSVATTVRYLVGDLFYEATFANGEPEGGWSVVGRDSAPRGPLAFGLLILTDENYGFGPPVGGEEVTQAGSADGGSVWTLTVPSDDGTAVQTWNIGPTGVLESYSLEREGFAPPLEAGAGPATSGRIVFRPVVDPEPIEAPDAGAPPDLSELDLPDDFPMRP